MEQMEKKIIKSTKKKMENKKKGNEMKIYQGDAQQEMLSMDDNSVDAIVTDPPYGLNFMGKKWDYDVPGVLMWKEALRVLKPGGFLLSFAGTRTYHRMAVNIEDAGFEIRDMIQWLYGSGFPKSLNIGKQIDKIQGNEREVVGVSDSKGIRSGANNIVGDDYEKQEYPLTKGNSQWEGYGTALKPANEPIVVARKPLSEKNVALNVLKWGTGGINIDGCRVEGVVPPTIQGSSSNSGIYNHNKGKDGRKEIYDGSKGRFPANIILDEEAGRMLDEQSGDCGGKWGKQGSFDGQLTETQVPPTTKEKLIDNEKFIGDKGGASRFFYCAKASKSERNLGCEELEAKEWKLQGRVGIEGRERLDGCKAPLKCGGVSKNNHPTVKPIKLMEYLIKLVSKEGATILDPFLGSGTTGIAAYKLNRKFIGIERENEYIKIAKARIKHYTDQKRLK